MLPTEERAKRQAKVELAEEDATIEMGAVGRGGLCRRGQGRSPGLQIGTRDSGGCDACAGTISVTIRAF